MVVTRRIDVSRIIKMNLPVYINRRDRAKSKEGMSREKGNRKIYVNHDEKQWYQT